ncbi:hypothetical protein MtrunA17_Chr8g0363141 [Medicago truncatula]|uniref:Uncharacterized protein n=1 Tax=Medicago truncatula TaxID=3880 RepID=I3S9H7_MEDTR|nr:unknown [Medicago truncatula]RHN41167.1 hypothetical protein MtrunA17_Chr8g0363141 [Medicago truncatula]
MQPIYLFRKLTIEAIAGEVKYNKERQIPQVWGNNTSKTHVMEIQTMDSVVSLITSDTNPSAYMRGC